MLVVALDGAGAGAVAVAVAVVGAAEMETKE